MVEYIHDTGYLPYCATCMEHLALGMMRDVQALLIGEEAAQKQYVDFMKRFRES